MPEDIEDQVQWPVPTHWLQEHGILSHAMRLDTFEGTTEAELIAEAPLFYLTVNELRALEPYWVSPEDEAV